MDQSSQINLPRLPAGFQSRLHYIAEWEAQGLMTMDKLFENWNEGASPIDIAYDHRGSFEPRFEAIAIEDENGTKRLDEANLIGFLRQHNVFPPTFKEVEPIIFRSACYFINYPFHTETSPTFTIKELDRVLWWLHPSPKSLSPEPCGGGSRDFTEIDNRRLLFQSLSTERNGRLFPFDRDEWRREARRRTLEVSPRQMSCRKQCDHFCCDEWGDELYHDLLDVVMSCQPPRPLPIMGERRDCFRPFVAGLHAEAPELREFTVSPDRLRAMVRICLYHNLGLGNEDHPLHVGDLEGATDCIMRAFPQDRDIGINWPMFDEGCKVAPHVFDALKHVVLLFWIDPSPIDERDLSIMRTSTRLFTGPLILQIGSILMHDALEWFDALLWSWYRGTALSPLAVLELLAPIKDRDDYVLILISGKDIQTRDLYTLGIFMPSVAKDGNRIQAESEDEPIPICSLWELSPAQGIYPGTIECPAWTMSGEDLLFGDPENGVALVLQNGASRATFIQTLDGEDEPIYNPIKWRGNRFAELEIDAIEIAYGDWDETLNSSRSDEDTFEEDPAAFSPTNSERD